MRTKMKKQAFVTGALLCVIAIAFSLFVFPFSERITQAKEAEGVQTEVQLKSVYTKGETVEIPANKLLFEGEYHDALVYFSQGRNYQEL